MKVCILTHTFPRFPGDTAAPFMGILADAISERGHKVFVLTPFDEKIETKYRSYKLITYKYIYPDKLHTLGYSKTLQDDKSMSIISYLLSPFLYFFGLVALLKLIKKENIDIICAHWIIPNGFISTVAKILTGVRYTTTIPGSDVYMGSKNYFFKWMVGRAAMNAEYVLSDSSHYLKQLNDLGFFPERTKVIRYGVDTKKFKPTKKDVDLLKKLNINNNQPVVLAVGRMVAKKGFKYLVKAMSLVVKKIPNVKLVMVGDGDQRQILEKEVNKLKIKNNVIFTGTISYDELSKYYNIADVFVMPSIKDEKGNIDASPVTMMEAMACGASVIATKFSGSDDIIIKGRTGYLVKEKNSKEISSSIINLLSKKIDLKKEIKQIAKNNFSSKSIAKKYEDIFNLVIK